MKESITSREFATLELFRGIPWENLRGYLESAGVRHLEEGEILISPHSTQHELFVLLEGQMEVRLENAQGIIVAHLKVGECVGEMSVFDDHDPSVWVRSAKPCRLLALSRETALAMLQASHVLALNLLQILSRRVRYSNRRRSEGERHIKVIEQQATVDSLTGLHNRYWMDQMFQRELLRCHAGDIDLCLLMADLDHFKGVNDVHGHLVGDQVLRFVAQLMTNTLRPTDMITRFGGEEFCILLPGEPRKHAESIAQRVRRTIERNPLILGNNTQLKITISIGIAQLAPNDTVSQLVERADRALYAAKQAGRNRVMHQ